MKLKWKGLFGKRQFFKFLTDNVVESHTKYGSGDSSSILIRIRICNPDNYNYKGTVGMQHMEHKGLLYARVPHFLRSNTKTVSSDAHFLRSNTKTVPSDALAPTLSPREFQHTCTLKDRYIKDSLVLKATTDCPGSNGFLIVNTDDCGPAFCSHYWLSHTQCNKLIP
jgi:hypothetical protein